MCKQCQSSSLGNARQAEYESAIATMRRPNLPARQGFSAGSANRRYSHEEQAAIERYHAALDAMKRLHTDYVFEQTRQASLDVQVRGKKPWSITHARPQSKP